MYIIDHYNLSVRIATQFLTLLMLCVLIFFNLKSTSNDRLLKNLSWQFYLLSEFLPEFCREKVAPKKNFFIFPLQKTEGLKIGYMSYKPTQYPLVYVQFAG